RCPDSIPTRRSSDLLPELLEELNVAKGTGEFRKTIASYLKVDLLILDEWLIRPLVQQESYNLLEVVEARIKSQKGSMIFCSQYQDRKSTRLNSSHVS